MGAPIIVSMKIPADEMGEFMKNLDLAVDEAHDRYVERLRFAAAAVCALDWSGNDADAVATIIELKNALEGVAETWARPKSDPTAVAADDAVEQVKRDLNIRGEAQPRKPRES